MRNIILSALCAVSFCLVFINPAFSQVSGLEKHLAVPGAGVTLPITAAKESFSKDFVQAAQRSFNSFHAQMGGDHALYYLLNFSSVMRTDMSMPNQEYIPLEYALNKSIGTITVTTDSEGALTLDDYIVHPTFRHQGMLMLHKG